LAVLPLVLHLFDAQYPVKRFELSGASGNETQSLWIKSPSLLND